MEDPEPYPITNGGQTRYARGPVHVQFRYIYLFISFLLSWNLVLNCLVSLSFSTDSVRHVGMSFNKKPFRQNRFSQKSFINFQRRKTIWIFRFGLRWVSTFDARSGSKPVNPGQNSSRTQCTQYEASLITFLFQIIWQARLLCILISKCGLCPIFIGKKQFWSLLHIFWQTHEKGENTQ